jgi:thiol-disulfide isomerase/thioredoxin
VWCLAASLTAAVIAFAPDGWAEPLQAGSDANACENMLAPGLMEPCRQASSAPPAAPTALAPKLSNPPASEPLSLAPSSETPPPIKSLPIGGVSEEDIDAFLANHGKPPREAVRALLNPTDANIRAMSAAQTRQIVNAVYVAERQAALNRDGKGANTLPPRELYTVLPHFLGMQFTLYVMPNCASCASTIADFRRLLENYPVVQGRLAVIAERDDQVIGALQQWQLVVAAERLTSAQAAALGLQQVPTLEVFDPRSKTRQRIVGAFTPQWVREAVLALRQAKSSGGTTP